MPSRNLWKKLNLPSNSSPSLPASRDAPPVFSRVRTSQDVKRAYNKRQTVRSTASGVYVLSQGRHAMSESALADQQSRPSSPDRSESCSRTPEMTQPSSPVLRAESSTSGWTSDYPSVPDPDVVHARYRSTRANQWLKWTTVVLPDLMDPYYTLLHTTDNLANVDRAHTCPCTCRRAQLRTLQVVCVHFDCT